MDLFERIVLPYLRRSLYELSGQLGWPTAILVAYVTLASLIWVYVITSGIAYLFVSRGSGYSSAPERILAEALVIATGALVLAGYNSAKRSPALSTGLFVVAVVLLGSLINWHGLPKISLIAILLVAGYASVWLFRSSGREPWRSKEEKTIGRVRDAYQEWRSTKWPVISAPIWKGLTVLLVYLSIAFIASSVVLVVGAEKGARVRELPLAVIALVAGIFVHTGVRVIPRLRLISGGLVVLGVLLMILLTAWNVMPIFVWLLGVGIGMTWSLIFARRAQRSS